MRILNSNLSETPGQSSKFSPKMLTYCKNKSEKLEKDFNKLEEMLNEVKSTCDLSKDLQNELTERNEEVSKLQQMVGELQIHLFKEKEQNLKLSAENDEMKIKDFENKKRIKALLIATGLCERKYLHFATKSSQNKLVEPKLPPKLQKLKELKQIETFELNALTNDLDPQVLLLNVSFSLATLEVVQAKNKIQEKNQLLASQLEHHIKLSSDEINVLLKEKELSEEERKIERQRLQKEIDLLMTKLKQSHDLLSETAEKLVKTQQVYVKEKNSWMEEKEKYTEIISHFKDKEGINVSDILDFCIHDAGKSKWTKSCNEKESVVMVKEQIYAAYQEQILALEAEVSRLRERAQICKNKFKEKTEKMTAQVSYLKNKYEDLDRRRQLEAEGFRTDIRMLRERVKELEKKLTKATTSFQSTEQSQLLISARNTLSRAKQLEKELAHMKSKISLLESSEGPAS